MFKGAEMNEKIQHAYTTLTIEDFEKAVKYLEGLETVKPPRFWLPVTTEEQAEYCRKLGINPVMQPHHFNPDAVKEEQYYIRR